VLIGAFLSLRDAVATRLMLQDAEFDQLAMSDDEYRRVSAEMDALADTYLGGRKEYVATHYETNTAQHPAAHQ
jgi:hypothetical protein